MGFDIIDNNTNLSIGESDFKLKATGSLKVVNKFASPLNGTQSYYSSVKGTTKSIIYDLNVPTLNNLIFKSIPYFKLKENHVLMEMKSKYNYRPDLASLDMYDHDMYSTLILAVNGIKSVLNFNSNRIKTNYLIIPTTDAIQKYILDKI